MSQATDFDEWRRRAESAYERVRSVVRETPVERMPFPSSDSKVFLKLEHLQHTGSFKFRGASHKIALLTDAQRRAGVITASNGNHGLAVAAAAHTHGLDCQVFVSSQVAPTKIQRIEAAGGHLQLAGDTPLDAELAARAAATATGRVFISPYNDADVIAGQATIGIELSRQVRHLDAVFAAVGGGGLIGGIGAYFKAVSPATEIIGAWPANSPVLYEAIRAGRVVDVAEKPSLSESTTGGLEADSITVGLCRNVVDRAVLVSEDEILRAMRLVLETEHWIVEGAAGVALAAFLRNASEYAGKTVAIVICGRNVSRSVLDRLRE